MIAHHLEIGIVPKRVPLWKDGDKDGGLYDESHAEDPDAQSRPVEAHPSESRLRPDPTTTEEE